MKPVPEHEAEHLKHVRHVHPPQAQRQRSVAGLLRGGGGSSHDDPARRVAIDTTRGLVLQEGILQWHHELRIGSDDRTLPVDLEAVAGALLGHQKIGDPKEASMKPTLQAPDGALAHRGGRGR